MTHTQDGSDVTSRADRSGQGEGEVGPAAAILCCRSPSYLLQVLLSGPGVCLYGAQVRYRVPVN